ncbi:MAG: cell division protein FtsZ [Bacilli bacterium]|nr:cell division protein FtsZ [Bacilli bacterium]
MSINNSHSSIRIVVIGVGGAGTNAVNNMIDETSPVEFFAMNTDAQSLDSAAIPAENRIVLGEELTNGLGAGGEPEMGHKAAEASIETIHNVVRGANIVFIAAGMGGGTGTGAAPVIAQACRDEKALTVAVVTRPFGFEGPKKIKRSIDGLNKLRDAVDAIIVVSNDKLLMNNGTATIQEAFQESDRVLSQSVSTITDLILMKGVINLDFADIRNTLANSGLALIGVGMGEGTSKARDAAEAAINSPLLETPIKGATRVICAVTCGPSVSLFEANECVRHITEAAGISIDDVKLGILINNQLGDQIIVSVIASGFKDNVAFSVDDYKKAETLQNETQAHPNEQEEESDSDILPDFLKDEEHK